VAEQHAIHVELNCGYPLSWGGGVCRRMVSRWLSVRGSTSCRLDLQRAVAAPRQAAKLSASIFRSLGLLALEALRIAVWRPRFRHRGRKRFRTSSIGYARPCTSTKAATAARRRWRRFTTSAIPPRNKLVMLYLDGSGYRYRRRAVMTSFSGTKTVGVKFDLSAARLY
jgi:hypothetical protein